MKKPTTPYCIALQNKIQINRQFLESKGWVLNEEYPSFESFVHTKNNDLVCSIGLYGSFYIAELHWCNKTPEKVFNTINPSLTIEDYETIIKLLNLTTLSNGK